VKAGLIVGGVLSLGTAFVFGAAAVTASLFPNGATVPAGGMDQSQVVWAPNGRLIGGAPVVVSGPDILLDPARAPDVTR
jgi:ABC-type branched-subunit amino acid transport system permease subunit